MISLNIRGCRLQVSEHRISKIRKAFQHAFDCFEHNVREVDVTFRDINGPKGGLDKICSVHMRLYPRGVIVAKALATTVEDSASLARDKVVTALHRCIEKKRRNLNLRKQRRQIAEHKQVIEEAVYGG